MSRCVPTIITTVSIYLKIMHFSIHYFLPLEVKVSMILGGTQVEMMMKMIKAWILIMRRMMKSNITCMQT